MIGGPANYKEIYQRTGLKLLFGFLTMAILLALFVWLTFQRIASSMPPVYLVGLRVGWLIFGMAVGLVGAATGSWRIVAMKPHSRSLAAGSLLVTVVGMALTHRIIHGLTPLHMTLNGVDALLMGLGVFFGFIVQILTLGLAQIFVRLAWHVMPLLKRPHPAEEADA